MEFVRDGMVLLSGESRPLRAGDVIHVDAKSTVEAANAGTRALPCRQGRSGGPGPCCDECVRQVCATSVCVRQERASARVLKIRNVLVVACRPCIV
jgi:hypothetical protein